jgi:16S rRNA (adenine1518-N6/adenine1519-N6)-dimethyltransferase
MDKNLLGRNLDQTGQHYMIDKKLIKFIVAEAMLENDDVVLEIGYGHGELTRAIAKKCNVIAIDIEKFDLNLKNLHLIQGNILNEIEKLKFTKVVSNIPYNISEPLMRKLFKIDFDLCVLTTGKNFADNLSKKDNRIGIIANHFYNIDVLKIVKPTSFNPHPRVDSAIVRIEPKTLESLNKSDIIMRELIFLDDKKLKNAFEKIFKDKTKKEIKEITKEKYYNKKIYELKNEEFIMVDGSLIQLGEK